MYTMHLVFYVFMMYSSVYMFVYIVFIQCVYDILMTCLQAVHTEHLQVMTRQLLSQQGLSASWEPVVLSCARQVTHFVRPDVRNEGDDLDIRKYIHIKKVRDSRSLMWMYISCVDLCVHVFMNLMLS